MRFFRSKTESVYHQRGPRQGCQWSPGSRWTWVWILVGYVPSGGGCDETWDRRLCSRIILVICFIGHPKKTFLLRGTLFHASTPLNSLKSWYALPASLASARRGWEIKFPHRFYQRRNYWTIPQVPGQIHHWASSRFSWVICCISVSTSSLVSDRVLAVKRHLQGCWPPLHCIMCLTWGVSAAPAPPYWQDLIRERVKLRW